MLLRRLILMRHGEADAPRHDAGDHGRSLTRAGVAQALKMASQLTAHGWRPEALVCSTAQRALSTAETVWAAMGLGLVLQEDASLYGGGLADVAHVVASVDEGATTALLVGHNPTFSEVASALSGSRLAMNTADAVLLRVQADTWADAATLHGGWELVEHLRAP